MHEKLVIKIGGCFLPIRGSSRQAGEAKYKTIKTFFLARHFKMILITTWHHASKKKVISYSARGQTKEVKKRNTNKQRVNFLVRNCIGNKVQSLFLLPVMLWPVPNDLSWLSHFIITLYDPVVLSSIPYRPTYHCHYFQFPV